VWKYKDGFRIDGLRKRQGLVKFSTSRNYWHWDWNVLYNIFYPSFVRERERRDERQDDIFLSRMSCRVWENEFGIPQKTRALALTPDPNFRG
jgi:hypothetical protein